jgi:hypothetical protein
MSQHTEYEYGYQEGYTDAVSDTVHDTEHGRGPAAAAAFRWAADRLTGPDVIFDNDADNAFVAGRLLDLADQAVTE